MFTVIAYFHNAPTHQSVHLRLEDAMRVVNELLRDKAYKVSIMQFKEG